MLLNTFEFYLMNNPIRRFIQRTIEIKRLKRLSNINENKDILEIGCGNGYGSQLIKEHFKPKKLIATDLDKRMIDIAKRKNTEIHFQITDAAQLPFKKTSFDAIIEFAIIHHIPNYKNCIKEMYRVLKPGGYILLEDLSIETFSTPFGMLLRKILDHPYKEMYTKKEFTEELKSAGFKDIDIKNYNPFFSFPYFVISAKK